MNKCKNNKKKKKRRKRNKHNICKIIHNLEILVCKLYNIKQTYQA